MTDAKYVKKAPRQSNLELSRILAMYLIVMHHFSVHGGVPIWSGSAPLSFNFYLDQLLSTGGKIGVNLFVLITGYFLAKKFSKFSSLIYLWIKTFSYVIVYVRLPEETRIVAGGAFYGNLALTSVRFPDSATWIGPAALKGCCRLGQVTWPRAVTREIGRAHV